MYYYLAAKISLFLIYASASIFSSPVGFKARYETIPDMANNCTSGFTKYTSKKTKKIKKEITHITI